MYKMASSKARSSAVSQFLAVPSSVPQFLGSKIPCSSPLVDLLCSICRLPVIDARQFDCGCRICGPCAQKSDCSNCSEKCGSISRIAVNFKDKAVQYELRHVSFPCYNSKCSWTGTNTMYREHIALCQFAEVHCPKGCDVIIAKHELNKHMETCHYITTNQECRWCYNISNGNATGKHCDHLNECKELTKQCQFSNYGCLFEGNHHELHDHYTHDVSRHLEMIEKTTSSLSSCGFHIQTEMKLPTCKCVQEGSYSVSNSELQLPKHRYSTNSIHPRPILEYDYGQAYICSYHGAGRSSCFVIGKPPITTPQIIKGQSTYDPLTMRYSKIATVCSKFMALKDESNHLLKNLQELFQSVESDLHKIQDSFQELVNEVQTLQAATYNGTFIWKIPEVTRRTKEAVSGKIISLYSAPFYTSRFGYKLCLRVYMDGDGSGKGSHLSLFITMMRGEYDALLQWPFTQMVTLLLLDQSNTTMRKQHIIQCFKPQLTSPSDSEPDMNIASGCPQFAPLSILHSSNYVQNDTLFFKVVVRD